MPLLPKRVLLATIGSLGDLHPCLAIALALKARGHHPLIASTAIYRDKVEGLGIEFHPIRPDIEAHNPQLTHRLMNMRRGPEFLLRDLLLPAVRDTFDDLLVPARTADLMVAGEIVFAAPLVAQKLGLPWASAILSPFSFLSAYDPSVSPMAPELAFLSRAGWLANKAMLRLGQFAVRSWRAPIRQLRKELGLPPASDPFFRGKFSPHLVLALFSPAIAGPQPDWPPNTIQPGYVYFDSDADGPRLLPELSTFLATGEAPIVFTLGSSAVHDPGSFFEESAAAANALQHPAVFLIGDNPPPASLGRNSIALPYAPFSKLFPHASVIVHQGGSGTTAQALYADKPALIMPCGFDQPDNAARIQRLGAALTVARSRYNARTAAGALAKLLHDRRYHEAAARIGKVLRAEDAITVAAGAIEALLATAAPAPAAPPASAAD